MPQVQNIDFNAIRQALARRAGAPAMGQAPATPVLSQVGTPVGTTPTGGGPTATTPSPQLANPPTPQPRFASPFAGPQAAVAGAGEGFDVETKRIAKTLIQKLLQIM